MTNELSDSPESERQRAPTGATLSAKARAQAERLAEPLRHDARLVAERQKEHGADRLVGLASAMHRAAQELEPELPQTAACIHDFAGGIERVSSSLRAQSVEDVTQKFTTVARNRPVALFGGAVLAGLALSRFLKSSDPMRR